MEKISLWGASICVFSVIIVLFKAMFPRGDIKKTGETVMVLLMLLVMLQPFAKMDLNAESLVPKDELFDWEAIQENNAYNSALKQVICEALLQYNIKVDDIQLETNRDDEQYLVLTALKIKTESDIEPVLSCLEELGIPKEIVEIGA